MKKITYNANRSEKLLKSLEKNAHNVSYSALCSALRKKDVIVNGVRQKQNTDVCEGDEVTVFLPDDAIKNNFSIFYEDDNVLIVNKGKQIEVCDGDNNVTDLLEATGKTVIPVHRIDRNTSGLVMFAKSQRAYAAFLDAFRESRVCKYYEAEVYGVPEKNEGVFVDYMQKDAAKMFVSVRSQPSNGFVKTETYYKVIKKSGKTALLQVQISGGFTHQIRASLAFHGLPIIGDEKYGKSDVNRTAGRRFQCLTATKLVFNFDENSFLRYLNGKNFELSAK